MHKDIRKLYSHATERARERLGHTVQFRKALRAIREGRSQIINRAGRTGDGIPTETHLVRMDGTEYQVVYCPCSSRIVTVIGAARVSTNLGQLLQAVVS